MSRFQAEIWITVVGVDDPDSEERKTISNICFDAALNLEAALRELHPLAMVELTNELILDGEDLES